MRDQRIHAQFVSSEEVLAATRLQGHRRARLDEVCRSDHACIDERQYRRVGNQRPKRFHQIQRESWTPEAWLMIEAPVRIEAQRMTRDRELFDQDTVGK